MESAAVVENYKPENSHIHLEKLQPLPFSAGRRVKGPVTAFF